VARIVQAAVCSPPCLQDECAVVYAEVYGRSYATVSVSTASCPANQTIDDKSDRLLDDWIA